MMSDRGRLFYVHVLCCAVSLSAQKSKIFIKSSWSVSSFVACGFGVPYGQLMPSEGRVPRPLGAGRMVFPVSSAGAFGHSRANE